MAKAEKKIEVVQDQSDPVTVEILATSIRDIAKGFARVEAAGLNRRAFLVLLKDSSGIPMADIERVLNALGNLESTYCAKKDKRAARA